MTAALKIAAAERTALAELLAELGPEAPTLCEGWRTAEMAAHLVTRDRRPDALPGLVLPGAARRRTESLERSRRDGTTYAELVAAVRQGAPRFLPMGLPLVRDLANIHEYFIHHEDVRRANGRGPRPGDPDRDRALWNLLRLQGRAMFRRAPVGVVLERPDGVRLRVKGGSPDVVVRGPVDELTLLGFNRKQAAQVSYEGPADAVERLRGVTFGA